MTKVRQDEVLAARTNGIYELLCREAPGAACTWFGVEGHHPGHDAKPTAGGEKMPRGLSSAADLDTTRSNNNGLQELATMINHSMIDRSTAGIEVTV